MDPKGEPDLVFEAFNSHFITLFSVTPALFHPSLHAEPLVFTPCLLPMKASADLKGLRCLNERCAEGSEQLYPRFLGQGATTFFVLLDSLFQDCFDSDTHPFMRKKAITATRE